MPFVLPASVRLALWVTAAFRGSVDLDTALTRAHPGVDDVRGDLARIREWAELGERTLLVALPRPGDLTGMPRAGPAACAAAAEAGECVFVAGSGGLLVPELSRFGPAGDEGVTATWTAYDSEPVPRHVLGALSLADLERALVDLLRRSTAELEQIGGVPWSGDPREEADRSLAGARWGMPDGLPTRAVRLMELAARVGHIAAAGVVLAAQGAPLEAHSALRRERVLRELQALAGTALAGATNVAVMQVAGWRPA